MIVPRATNDLIRRYSNNNNNSNDVSDSQVENTTSDTSGKDITKEVVENIGDGGIFSIEELVPPNAPITIPYLELFRTDELEYVPYISPYNVGIQSDSGEESSEDTSSSDTSSEDNSDTSNGGSSSTQ